MVAARAKGQATGRLFFGPDIVGAFLSELAPRPSRRKDALGDRSGPANRAVRVRNPVPRYGPSPCRPGV